LSAGCPTEDDDDEKEEELEGVEKKRNKIQKNNKLFKRIT